MIAEMKQRNHNQAGRRRTLNALLLGLMVAVVCDIPTVAQEPQVGVPIITRDRKKEYNVKSVYLYNFARYIEWPAITAMPDATFRIGVFGSSPVSVPLVKLAKLRTITDRRTGRTRKIDVVPFDKVEDAPICHMVFISEAKPPTALKMLIDKFKGQPVMLVGETIDFAKSGGTSEFLLEGNGVRFSLNLGDLQSKGLKADAKLLKAAQKIIQTAAK